MRALLHITDVALGATLDTSAAALAPVLPCFMQAQVPSDLKPGDAVYVVVKATVQSVLPG